MGDGSGAETRSSILKGFACPLGYGKSSLIFSEEQEGRGLVPRRPGPQADPGGAGRGQSSGLGSREMSGVQAAQTAALL